MTRRLPAAAGTCLALIAGLLVGSAPTAGAVTCPGSATKTWNGGTGDWTNPARWSPPGVPTAADNVRVQTGTTTITGMSGSVCALTLDPAGGTIRVSGALEVLDDVAIGVGAVAADSGVTTQPRLQVDGDGTLAANVTLDGVALAMAGALDLAGRTLTATNGALLGLGDGASLTSSSNGGLAVVKSSARLGLAGATSLVSPAVVQVQDGGALDTGGAPARLGGTGTVNWQAGQLLGDLTLAARTVADGAGTRVVPAGSAVQLEAATDVAGGVLQVDGSLTATSTLRLYPGVQVVSSTGTGRLAAVGTAGALAVGASDVVTGSGDVTLTSVGLTVSGGLLSVVSGTRLLATTSALTLSGATVVDPYAATSTRGVLQVGTGSSLAVVGTTTLQQGATVRLSGSGAALTGGAGAALAGSGTFDWRQGSVTGPLSVSGVQTTVSSAGAGTARSLTGALALAGPATVDSTQVSVLGQVQVLGTTTLDGPGAGFVRAAADPGQASVTVLPTGTLRRSDPQDPSAAPAVVDVPLVNNGSISVAGPLRVQAGLTQVRATGPDPAAVPDPVTSLLGGPARLDAVTGSGVHQPLKLAEGGLGGAGTVAATRLTLGSTWLHPGFQSAAGTIRVEGDLTLGAQSDVQLVLRDAGTKGQPKEADRLVVAPLVENGATRSMGRATLAGRVTGVSAGSYSPAYGTVVPDLVRFVARSGSFGHGSSFGTPSGLGWRPRYDSSTKDGDGLGVDLRLSDVAPPALGLARVPAFTQSASQRVTYAAVDNRTGVATYDARWRRGDPSATKVGTWHRPKAWQRTRSTSQRLTGLRPGITTCFSVRVRDRAGNVSRWTQPLCTARLLDDRRLAASAGWTRVSGRAGFYGGTFSRATAHGARLTRRGAFTRIGLTAVRCPGCGRLQVLVGSKVVKTVRLDGPRNSVVSWVSPLRPERRARVSFRVASSGKPVVVDSAGLLR
jgi:hypothetical protein